MKIHRLSRGETLNLSHPEGDRNTEFLIWHHSFMCFMRFMVISCFQDFELRDLG